MKKLRWELVKSAPKGIGNGDPNHDIETWRAEVPGGWLVSVWALRTEADASGPKVLGGANWGGGVTFLPDPDHRWLNDK